MKTYVIEEEKYSELEEWVEKIVDCGKKLLHKMEEGEFGSRMGRRDYEDDDYDWKLKKGYPNRYKY